MRWSFACLALVLAACPQPDGADDPTDTPDETDDTDLAPLGLALDPPSLTAALGEAATVALTLTFDPAAGPVTLSVDAPAGVAATVERVGEAAEATLSLDVARTATPGTYDLTVTARQDREVEATMTLVLEPMTVRGTVRNLRGDPAVGAMVTLIGAEPVTTGGDGSFTVAGVVPPYDLLVATQEGESVWLDLTRPDPSIKTVTERALTSSATVTGAVSGGGGIPVPADHRTAVVAAGDGVIGSATPSADGPYAMTVVWDGGGGRDAVVEAVQTRVDEDGATVAVTGYARRELAVAAGGAFTAIDLALAPVDARVLSGTFTPPAGHVAAGFRRGGIRTASGALVWLGMLEAGSFSTLLPAPAGSSPVIGLSWDGLERGSEATVVLEGLAHGATGVAVAAPAVPRLLTPVWDGGAREVWGVDDAFTWEALEGGVHVLQLDQVPVGVGTFRRVVTTRTRVTLGELAALGIDLAPGGYHSASLVTYAPFADVDAAAVADGPPYSGLSTGYRLADEPSYFDTAP